MDAMDLEKGLEKDVSQLGILCHHCSTTDLTCPKTQKTDRGLLRTNGNPVRGYEAVCCTVHPPWPYSRSHQPPRRGVVNHQKEEEEDVVEEEWAEPLEERR
uniref:Nanos-type domain-containing protein n=1 Tax=Caenorhabditis tropicalis TaxID=1561998 RepID=A0A1I7TFN7_9PELO